ncbi:MAG TPA: 8-oxo-dGTP diphosphatase [Clostridia bacterium]|nr:8-oxo-dGTP diphosphatase [Clostridia bacterium]
MENAELTTLCMVRDPETGRVLVQNRRKSWKGIAFPGGHVEPGESLVACAKREVWEETGLTVRNLTLCGVKDWYEAEANKRYLVFLFATECFEGELRTDCEEGEALWVSQEELWSMPLAHGFSDTLRTMLTPEICEQFFEIRDDGQWVTHLL